MDVREFAKVINADTYRDRSLVNFLSRSNYEAPLLDDNELPDGTKALCEKSRALVQHTDFILPNPIDTSTEVNFGILKTTINDLMAPYAGVQPKYVTGPPGLGKTTIAYAMANVVSAETKGRVAVFHVNGAIDGNQNLLAKRVSASTTTDTVTHMALYGALHPITADFLYKPHESDPQIKRYQSISTLAEPEFKQLVSLMHRYDLWPVPSNREDWNRELLGVPQLTTLGATLLPQYGLDSNGNPKVRDNVVCFFVFDEFNQIEDQKAAAVIVGAFSSDTARTGNPFGSGFPSGWLNSMVASGQYNKHRFMFAAGNDPDISGGDTTPMDAITSRLFTSTFSMPREMTAPSLSRIMACNMLKRVTHKEDPFRTATVDDIANRPDEFQMKSPVLNASSAAFKNLLGSVINFESHVRGSLVSNSAPGVTPIYMEAVREYTLKYAERGWKNVLNMRNLVNLSQNLASLRLDADKDTNAACIESEIVKSLLGATAASMIKEDAKVSDLLDANLPDGTTLRGSVNQLCESLDTSRTIGARSAAVPVPARTASVADLFKRSIPRPQIQKYMEALEDSKPELAQALAGSLDKVESINAMTIPGSKKMVVRLSAKTQGGTAADLPQPVTEKLSAPGEFSREDVAKVNAWLMHGALQEQAQKPGAGSATFNFTFTCIQQDANSQWEYKSISAPKGTLRAMLARHTNATSFPPPLEDIEKFTSADEVLFKESAAKKVTIAPASPDLAIVQGR